MVVTTNRPSFKRRHELAEVPLVEILLVGFFCFLPILAIEAPRFLTVAPGIAGLGLFFTHRFAFGKWPKMSRGAFAWVAALGALMGASVLWAYNPDAALERTLKTFPLLLSGALLFSMTRKMKGSVFRKYFPFAMIATAALINIELYANLPLFKILHPDTSSAFAGDNFSGLNRGTVFFSLCFFPALACFEKNYKSWSFILLAFLTGSIFYRTDSQSAQMVLLGGSILYFLFPYRVKAAWIALGAVLVAALFAMPWIVQWGFQSFAAYSAASSQGWLQHSYASLRLEIWDFIARRALESPLIGYGVEATEYMIFDTVKLYFPDDHVLHPHNFVLQLWLEFGILGPFFAAVFFCTLMKEIYKSERPAQRTLLALLFGTIAAAATSYGLWQGWWVGVFCLLIPFGLLASSQSPQVHHALK